ncbi:coiled-coil domain-containing protein 9 isoform X3 [Hemibagrus wyckioides]|uniref:coiled-coil domain-containing protein 9 isoform X3 n=1 Tax=Hemibagrus wyckioides TaxID=337641 RepID=UPI00266B4047|nr:coiled-coil domain-containing protein 9 isoform X3 [Hemibagrus wyckioides]
MSAVVDLKTKEEKDAELDRRIEALRKKNEALMKRHQEIEEDKKKAEQEGIAVTTHRKPRAHEPDSDRRKIEKENLTVTVDLSKPSGESRMVNDRQLASQHADRETEDGFSSRPQHRTGSGRLSRGGQRGGGHRPERREPREGEGGGGEGPSHIERSRGGRRGGRGGGGGGGGGGGRGGIMQQSGSGSDRKSKEWEEKRRQNIEKMNEEMEKIAEYERGQRADGEKNPIRNFLDDPRRSGPIPEVDRKEGSRRHVRNWGGLDFENVKTGADSEKEWTNRRPGGKGSVDMTLSMTGRERAEYLRWKKERAQIDEERLARHRNATGQWRREWDAQKTDTMFIEDPAVAGEGMPEPGSRRADRGRNARTQQRSGATDDNRKPPKAPTFGDFLGQGKPREAGRGGRGRGKGRAQGKSYSMHDNRWEAEKEEEKGKKEEQEKEKTKEEDKPKAPIEKQTAVAVEKSVAEDEDDEWEDASDGDEVEDEEVEVLKDKEVSSKESKPIEKSPSSPAASTPSPKPQRTPRPKVHIPSSPQESLATPEGTKPVSPFSPLEGHQPVTDWGEEMEMLSPKSSLGESPLRPSSNESSPAQNKSREEENHSDAATNQPLQSDKQHDTPPADSAAPVHLEDSASSQQADSTSSSNNPTEPAEDTTTQKDESEETEETLGLDLNESRSESAAPAESTDQPCSG